MEKYNLLFFLFCTNIFQLYKENQPCCIIWAVFQLHHEEDKCNYLVGDEVVLSEGPTTVDRGLNVFDGVGSDGFSRTLKDVKCNNPKFSNFSLIFVYHRNVNYVSTPTYCQQRIILRK